MKKLFNTQHNVGKVKYLVSFHDGQTTNKDGSPFFGIRTFTRKDKFEAFQEALQSLGYVYGTSSDTEEIDGIAYPILEFYESLNRAWDREPEALIEAGITDQVFNNIARLAMGEPAPEVDTFVPLVRLEFTKKTDGKRYGTRWMNQSEIAKEKSFLELEGATDIKERTQRSEKIAHTYTLKEEFDNCPELEAVYRGIASSELTRRKKIWEKVCEFKAGYTVAKDPETNYGREFDLYHLYTTKDEKITFIKKVSAHSILDNYNLDRVEIRDGRIFWMGESYPKDGANRLKLTELSNKGYIFS